MMARLREADVLLVLVSLLLLPGSVATESKALTVQKSTSTDRFQNQNQAAGLLDTGGRLQVVHLPNDDGESYELLTQTGKQRRISHIKASLLSIGLFATIVRNLVFVENLSRNDWVGFCFLLILYLVEAASCSTRRYLSNIMTPSQVKDYLAQLQEVPPRVRFHLECYHYEDEDGFRASYHSSYRRRHEASHNSRRVTHRASDVFVFEKWRDVTKLKEAMDSIEYGSNNKATYLKLTLAKLLLFMNPMAYQDYLLQHARFVFREGNRDRYTDSWTTIEVDGYTRKLLACRTVIGSEPHVRTPVFWFFTLLGMTVPYRMWFSRNCDALDLCLSKQVS